MTNRFFTVLILRQAGQRFRKLRLSYPFAGVMAALVVVLAFSGLYAPRLMLRLRTQSLELDRLEQENQRLRTEQERFDGAMEQVSSRLETFEAQAVRLAEELGVEGLPAAEGGAGGTTAGAVPPERYRFEGEVRGLQSRATTLGDSMGALDEAFQHRLSELSATPSTMPVEGWFSHGYGWRKDPWSGERDFHGGIDIVAPSNTEILAPGDGVVSRAGRYPQLGKSLDIAHGYGYVTRYAHLNELRVRAGERVRRGDVLGLVGSTGRSTGPHLHYEVFRDGRRVNPWKYLGRD
jgi:murein DD-endopeptidase MepM/ murein hydrolase activator NlpD